jgi:hypothetical protein
MVSAIMVGRAWQNKEAHIMEAKKQEREWLLLSFLLFPLLFILGHLPIMLHIIRGRSSSLS